jgi:hypothetical protein
MSNASWPAVHDRAARRLAAAGLRRVQRPGQLGDGGRRPGVPFDEARGADAGVLRRHGLPPWAQVVVGSDTGDGSPDAGWDAARPGEADSELQLASVAQAVPRRTRAAAASPARSRCGRRSRRPGWPTTPGAAHHDDAVAVLEGPTRSASSSGARPAGRSSRRAGSRRGTGPASPTCGCSPDHRRDAARARGDGRAAGAGRRSGAPPRRTCRSAGTTHAGLALYAALGFRTHHTYRYLAAPRR